jgi:hypothetical protein
MHPKSGCADFFSFGKKSSWTILLSSSSLPQEIEKNKNIITSFLCHGALAFLY